MDLEVIETGNGGDIVKLPKDLSVINGFQNMVYLCLFGGNVQASTPIKRAASEQAFDWWGNDLFFKGDTSKQFNSETERTLKSVSLTSSGRILIEQAVKKDLESMKPFADLSVEVTIPNLDRVRIAVQIVKPTNLQDKEFIYIWDASINELTVES